MILKYTTTLRWKKTPDADTVKFVYDQFGHLRYSQDAVQKQNNKFTFMVYDKLDRVLHSGIYPGTNANLFKFLYNRDAKSNYADTSSISLDANKTLINYYDEKPSLALAPWSSMAAYLKDSVNVNYMLGELTYSASRVELGNSPWNYVASEKDIFGRVKTNSKRRKWVFNTREV